MKQSLSILHIIPNLQKGGAERLVLTICNELAKYDFIKVKIVCFSDINHYQSITQTTMWEVIPADVHLSMRQKSKYAIADLQAFIDGFKPDIIHTHLWKAEIISRHLSCQNATWFSHAHDNMPQLQKLRVPLSKRRITNWYERSILLPKYVETNTKFFAISHDVFAYLYQNLPRALRKNIILQHNAIDVSRFLKPENFKKTSDCLHLVSVGSLVRKKNHLFLLSVVEELTRAHIPCKLDILGEGPLRKEIESQIIRRKLENTVFLHGNAEVENFYWNADIYVHPATYEPFGLVILEAMAAGLPVICIDGRGNRDIIQQGVNGYLLHTKNPTVFAEKIIHVYTQQSLRENLQKEALHTAKEFDISQYVKKLLDIYMA